MLLLTAVILILFRLFFFYHLYTLWRGPEPVLWFLLFAFVAERTVNWPLITCSNHFGFLLLYLLLKMSPKKKVKTRRQRQRFCQLALPHYSFTVNVIHKIFTLAYVDLSCISVFISGVRTKFTFQNHPLWKLTSDGAATYYSLLHSNICVVVEINTYIRARHLFYTPLYER